MAHCCYWTCSPQISSFKQVGRLSNVAAYHPAVVFRAHYYVAMSCFAILHCRRLTSITSLFVMSTAKSLVYCVCPAAATSAAYIVGTFLLFCFIFLVSMWYFFHDDIIFFL